MARTKATVRRLPVKTRQLPAWLVNREYGTQKGQFILSTNHKSNKCKKKIQVFQRQEQANLLTVLFFS